MNRPNKELITEWSLNSYADYTNELEKYCDFLEDKTRETLFQICYLKQDYSDLFEKNKALEKSLDKACSELEEYTYMKCEYHCGGGCYNENKEECDDVCFFKNLQSAQGWKEHLLEDE